MVFIGNSKNLMQNEPKNRRLTQQNTRLETDTMNDSSNRLVKKHDFIKSEKHENPKTQTPIKLKPIPENYISHAFVLG